MENWLSSLFSFLASNGFSLYKQNKTSNHKSTDTSTDSTLTRELVQSLQFAVKSRGRFYVIDIYDSSKDLHLHFLVPSHRDMQFLGRRYVSPLIVIPNKDDWKSGDIDWSKGTYIPAYWLHMVGKFLTIRNSKSASDKKVYPLVPSLGIFYFKMNFDKDNVFNSTKFPVWYDITHYNEVGRRSYQELIILPLFSEHDVSSYRKYRAVSPTQRGIVCPVHTPESKKIGFHVFMAKGARYDQQTFSLIPVDKSNEEAMFSTAVLHVPYINYSDAPRVMMGAKNYRQAVKVKGAQKPIISTGYEEEFLGVNALVVYGLYYGYTVEDGIVVSKSFAKKLFVEDTLYVKEVIGAGMLKDADIRRRGEKIEPWGVLMKYKSFGKERVLRFPSFVEGEIVDVRFTPPKNMIIQPTKNDASEQDSVKVEFVIKVKRPLMVGDKLTGRHGNKGVVSKIVDDKDMPHVNIDGKWKPADVVLTPLGVISRKNIGALIETSFSMAKKEAGINVPQGAWVDLTDEDINKVRKALMKIGADHWGRFQVRLNGRQFYALAGYQYILRLHHHGEGKLSARRDGPRNIFGQPLGGRKNKGGQRVGEMEVWSVMSHGGREVLRYLISLRNGVAQDVFLYILKLMGIYVEIGKGKTSWRWMTPHDYRKMIEQVNDVEQIDNRLKLFKVKGEEGYYVSSLLTPFLFKKSIVDRRSFKPKPVMTENFRLKKQYFNVFLELLFGKQIKSAKGVSTIQSLWKKMKEDKNVKDTKPSKMGIIRRFILGGRVNMSGRAVIVPDPTLPIGEIRIPKHIMDTWGVKEGWVLLGRQPSLHKHSIMTFYGKPWNQMAIAINPLICSGFGADFDGDTMWLVYLDNKQYPSMNSEIRQMVLSNHFSLSRIVEPALLLGHDYAWGYFLKENAIGRDVMKFIQDPQGKFDRNIEEKEIKRLYWHIKDLLVKDELTEDVLDSLADYVEIATYYPPSFTYFMLRDQLSFISTLHFSGARGDKEAVKELVKGVNLSEEVRSLFGVKGIRSFAQGLDIDMFWAVAYRGRNSMMDKKLTVASSGGTTRQMVYRLSHLVWADVKEEIKRRCPSSCIERIERYYVKGLTDGYPVGVFLGQMLGERATQLAMKTFHTGAQAESGSLLMSFLRYIGSMLKKEKKVFASEEEVIKYLMLHALHFAWEKAGLKGKELDKYIGKDDVVDDKKLEEIDGIPLDKKNQLISKYRFVVKLINSFDPVWLVMGSIFLSEKASLQGLSALAYRPSAIRDIVNDINDAKENKVEYNEQSEILKWLGVV